MQILKYFGFVGALVAFSSCVTAGRYHTDVDALTAQLGDCKNQLNACQADDAKQKQDLVSCQQQVVSITKDRGQMKSSLDDLKKAMDEMKTRQDEEQKRLKEFRDLTARFKSLTDSGTLSVKIIDGKMVVSLGSDVLFAPGSAHLSAKGVDTVKEVSKQLAAIQGKRYQVEGHTDNVPIATATFPSNWELGSARAITVMKAMIDAGMPANRVSSASFADTSPLQANDTPEGRAANRRIAIVVVPDLSSLPGYDELQKMSQ
jgi:chemotaxis protein MotB